MPAWVNTDNLELYLLGDETQENAAVDIVINIAQIVRSRHFSYAPDSEYLDLVSEAFTLVWGKLREDFVDFEHHSAFNYIYTHARNAMQNYLTKRKEYRELRMGDFPETFEKTVLATTEGKTPSVSALCLTAPPELCIEYDKIKTRYDRIAPCCLPDISQAILDGCDFSENKKLTPAGEALLVASFRSYMHIAVKWTTDNDN